MRPIPCPRCRTHCHVTQWGNSATPIADNSTIEIVCGVCGWAMTQYGDVNTVDAALERHRSVRSGPCEQMKDPMER